MDGDPIIVTETVGLPWVMQDKWTHCTLSNPHTLQQRKLTSKHNNLGLEDALETS